MPKGANAIESFSLDGLMLGPPQVLGGVRLVPILRANAPGDLRLARRAYEEDSTLVLLDDKTAYYSYVPHALVATWSTKGQPVAAYGTQIKEHKPNKTKDGKTFDLGFMTARVMRKMRAKEDKNRMRFLPLDIAMEGFLANHFGGPTVLWEEYSKAAIQTGLSPRFESTIPGRRIVGLQDALRVFEVHKRQVGTLVFVGDALASAFVVPHPNDYMQLHRTLLTDFYGDLIYQYGLLAQENVYHPQEIDASAIHSVADLRSELGRLRNDWAALHHLMTTRLFERSVDAKVSYTMGPFSMQTFKTDLNPKAENHIGELILRDDGTIEYLKTFRLSAAQCRRAYLLKTLAESDWELEACGKKLDCTKNQLVYRLEKAGFGYLLHQHVLDAAHAEMRRKS